jgi:hypothetical protein
MYIHFFNCIGFLLVLSLGEPACLSGRVGWGLFASLNKHKKVKKLFFTFPQKDVKLFNYFLCLGSSETVNFFLPFARRAFRTLRPLAVDILSLKPCLFLLFLFDG